MTLWRQASALGDDGRVNRDGIGDRKVALRSRIRARRAAREATPDAAALIAGVLVPYCRAGTWVTAYAAMPGEPPTSELLPGLVAAGARVALPVIGPHRTLRWGEFTGAGSMERTAWGMDEPSGTPVATDAERLLSLGISAMVIPALAVSPDGTRLGQGGGFYDTLLAGIPRYSDGGPVRIALVWDDEIVEDLPRDDHDEPVDMIATASRLVTIGE